MDTEDAVRDVGRIHGDFQRTGTVVPVLRHRHFSPHDTAGQTNSADAVSYTHLDVYKRQTLVLAPDATARAMNLRSEALRAGQFAPIASGKFRSFGGGSAVVYAQDVNRDGTLANVFVERNHGSLVEVALANRARHAVSADGMTHILTLYDLSLIHI